MHIVYFIIWVLRNRNQNVFFCNKRFYIQFVGILKNRIDFFQKTKKKHVHKCVDEEKRRQNGRGYGDTTNGV
jgi:hypothetical protein